MSELKIGLIVTRNRMSKEPSFHIAVCMWNNRDQCKRHFQRITTLKTITAPDIHAALAYAEKWFGITPEMYQ